MSSKRPKSLGIDVVNTHACSYSNVHTTYTNDNEVFFKKGRGVEADNAYSLASVTHTKTARKLM